MARGGQPFATLARLPTSFWSADSQCVGQRSSGRLGAPMHRSASALCARHSASSALLANNALSTCLGTAIKYGGEFLSSPSVAPLLELALYGTFGWMAVED